MTWYVETVAHVLPVAAAPEDARDALRAVAPSGTAAPVGVRIGNRVAPLEVLADLGDGLWASLRVHVSSDGRGGSRLHASGYFWGGLDEPRIGAPTAEERLRCQAAVDDIAARAADHIGHHLRARIRGTALD